MGIYSEWQKQWLPLNISWEERAAKNHPKKQMKGWSTLMGLTLESPLGTSAGATCIFLLISALLRSFLKPDLLSLMSQ